jgi:hypothetical protein
MGALSAPLEWSETLMPGITLKRAFPFLTRRLAIDPVRRLGSVAIIAKSPVKAGGKVVRKAGRTLGTVTRRIRRVIRSPF